MVDNAMVVPTTFQICILGYLANVNITNKGIIGFLTTIDVPAFHINLGGYRHTSELITECTDLVDSEIKDYIQSGKKLPGPDFYTNVTQRIMMLEDKVEWLMNNA